MTDRKTRTPRNTTEGKGGGSESENQGQKPSETGSKEGREGRSQLPGLGGGGVCGGRLRRRAGSRGGAIQVRSSGGGAGGDEGDPGAGRLSAGVRAGLSGRRGRRWRPQAGGVGPAGPGRGRRARGDGGGAFTWPCARNLYSQHASTTWEPEGSRCAAESLGLILCTIKHSAASPSCSYTSSTLNKHNDDIRCNSR